MTWSEGRSCDVGLGLGLGLGLDLPCEHRACEKGWEKEVMKNVERLLGNNSFLSFLQKNYI